MLWILGREGTFYVQQKYREWLQWRTTHDECILLKEKECQKCFGKSQEWYKEHADLSICTKFYHEGERHEDFENEKIWYFWAPS